MKWNHSVSFNYELFLRKRAQMENEYRKRSDDDKRDADEEMNRNNKNY